CRGMENHVGKSWANRLSTSRSVGAYVNDSFSSQSRNLSRHDRMLFGRVQRWAEVSPPPRESSRRLQGAHSRRLQKDGRLESGAAKRRCAARQMVGDFWRSAIEFIGREGECFKPKHCRRNGKFLCRARPGEGSAIA